MRWAILLFSLVVVVGAAVWLVLPGTSTRPLADPVLVAGGQTVFEQHCSACHSERTTYIAPGLGDLMGRQAGTTRFANSPALRSAGFVWDADHLDAFLADPRGYIPNNEMGFFGLDNTEDRAALIAYVETL